MFLLCQHYFQWTSVALNTQNNFKSWIPARWYILDQWLFLQSTNNLHCLLDCAWNVQLFYCTCLKRHQICYHGRALWLSFEQCAPHKAHAQMANLQQQSYWERCLSLLLWPCLLSYTPLKCQETVNSMLRQNTFLLFLTHLKWINVFANSHQSSVLLHRGIYCYLLISSGHQLVQWT